MDCVNKWAVFVFAFAATSFAQPVVRTWVSASGSDSNPCTRVLPCRNFAAAIAAVAPTGEVVVLDSGGYGPVVIDKAVSVISPQGVHAAIAPTSGTAITVNDARVSLSNLYLRGQGAAMGVRATGTQPVFVEGGTFDGFISVGIRAESEYFFVDDCVFRNNGGGVWAGGPPDGVRISIDGSRFEHNLGNAMFADNHCIMTVRDTAATGNSSAGFLAVATEGTTEITVMSCQSARNGYGLRVDGGSARIAVGYSAIVQNLYGFHTQNNGQIHTFENNMFYSNQTPVTGTVFPFTLE